MNDDWQVHLESTREHQIRADFQWLNRPNSIREYIFIAQMPKKVTMTIIDPTMNDIIPY